MPILIYTPCPDGIFGKSALETAVYAAELAQKISDKVTALTFNAKNPELLGKYGVSKIYNLSSDVFENFDATLYSQAIAEVTKREAASVLIFDALPNSKTVMPCVAALLSAEFVSNVVALPESVSPFLVKGKCFSGKATALVNISSDIKILQIIGNIFEIKESPTAIETVNVSDFEGYKPLVQVVKKEKPSKKVSLFNAEVVVSGGRGIGQEHFSLIDELAEVLNAATACSKPVSDMGWRPHSEHVGQTGRHISPKVYIAIGISGSVQHLAGVSDSENIVVINNDPEAPFFKSADYGAVGDVLTVVPKLIAKLKTLKNE